MPRLRKKKRLHREIEPDEIFVDAANVGDFDQDRFEGRIERPLSRRAVFVVLAIASFFMLLYVGRAWNLQFINGVAYAKQAAENQLSQQVVFADRGEIVDVKGRPLVTNARASVDQEFATRVYATTTGLSHVMGYTKPPAKDSSGFYYRDHYIGVDGVEQIYDSELQGQNGLRLTETDARGNVVSESTQVEPVAGQTLTLSIDADVTQGLYEAIKARAEASGFQGGAGVIMDIETGQLLALTSYPEYSSEALSSGDQAALQALLADTRQPFLNRATNGLYAPGSIVKPIVGLAALNEGVIDANKQILSTGSISIPNPYDPAHPSIFKDWRAQGYVNMEQALAVSSDVYFYEVGGGYQTQPGLGIDKLDQYFRMFGFGAPTNFFGISEPSGTIPTPAWKATNFPGDPWRIGDTYHTAIGQYGLQITPLQAVREAAAIANSGTLLTPTLLASSSPEAASHINIPGRDFEIVREGMRLGVTDGIGQAVNLPYVHVAVKTGTAQVGVNNQYENSWAIGFYPYEHPKYAFAVVLEKGPSTTTVGAAPAFGQFLMWMHDHELQYLGLSTSTASAL